jgi:hypothetical protein
MWNTSIEIIFYQPPSDTYLYQLIKASFRLHHATLSAGSTESLTPLLFCSFSHNPMQIRIVFSTFIHPYRIAFSSEYGQLRHRGGGDVTNQQLCRLLFEPKRVALGRWHRPGRTPIHHHHMNQDRNRRNERERASKDP